MLTNDAMEAHSVACERFSLTSTTLLKCGGLRQLFLLLAVFSSTLALAEPRKYVFTEALEVESELGAFSRALHYGKVLLTAAMEPTGYYLVTQDAVGTALIYAGVLSYSLPKGVIGTQADQMFRMGIKTRSRLSDLSELPGFKSIELLQAVQYEYQWLQAVRAKLKGLATVTVDSPLSKEALDRWDGKLVALEEFPDAKLVLVFRYGDQKAGQIWEIDGKALSQMAVLPEEMRAEWIRAYEHAKPWGADIIIEAELKLDADRSLQLGPILTGRQVKNFLGIGWKRFLRPAWVRMRRLAGRPELPMSYWKPKTYGAKSLNAVAAASSVLSYLLPGFQRQRGDATACASLFSDQ